MRLISFGIDSQHAGNFRSLHKELIQHLLPEEVEFVGEYSSKDTGSIVSIFTDYTVQHFCEPPDTCVRGCCVPLRWYWFFTEKMAKDIFICVWRIMTIQQMGMGILGFIQYMGFTI